MAWSGTNPADWAQRQKERLRNIYRSSVQDMLNEMGSGSGSGSLGPGLLPVKTGNLARSAIVQIGKPVSVQDDGTFTGPDAAAIVNLDIGVTAHLGWQAKYAKRVNYGFVGTDALGRTYNQAGRGFAEAIAARWPRYVAEATKNAG